MAKFCTNCGKEISVEDAVCANCGTPVDGVQRNVGVNNNAVQQKKTNGLAIAGFVTSLVSIICCGSFSIISLILSIIGAVKAKDYGGNGKGMAIAGIIISIITIILIIAIIVIAAMLGAYEEVAYSY